MEELFAQRLSELIENSNYILADLEETVGKKAATISRYASGEIKGVKRETIVKLANFFGVSPAWLAGLSNEKYANTKTDKFGNSVTPIPILRYS
jgi:transcriptional regulator with XRE-family HTH domain